MKRIERIENHGYKVTRFMSGRGVQASKGSAKITAGSITQLHQMIFGY